jgi:hypothetical protein
MNTNVIDQDFDALFGATVEIVIPSTAKEKVFLQTSAFKPETEGWILLRYSKKSIVGKREVTVNEYAIHEGKLLRLQQFINHFVTKGSLPGKVRIEEYLLSQVPTEYVNLYLTPSDYYSPGYKPKTVEDLLYKNGYKADQDSPVYTYNGELIMRFNTWDPTGIAPDVYHPYNGSTHDINGARFGVRKPERIEPLKFKLPTVNPL